MSGILRIEVGILSSTFHFPEIMLNLITF